MPAKLIFYPPRRASRLHLLQDGETLVIGRDRECGLVLDEACVSKKHARLQWSGPGWTLQDLRSKNGTKVNGVRSPETSLRSGDEIDLGGLLGRFEFLTPAQAATLASERLARIQTTAAMRRQLDTTLEPEVLLRRFLESAMEAAAAERGFVLVVGESGGLRVAAAAGFSIRQLGDPRFRGSVGAVRETLASGGPVVVSDVAADPALGKRTSVVAQGIGSLACLPLRHEGRIIGVLYVDSRLKVRPLGPVDLEILEALADHTAAVLGTRPVGDREPREPVEAMLLELQQRIEELFPAADFA